MRHLHRAAIVANRLRAGGCQNTSNIAGGPRRRGRRQDIQNILGQLFIEMNPPCVRGTQTLVHTLGHRVFLLGIGRGNFKNVEPALDGSGQHAGVVAGVLAVLKMLVIPAKAGIQRLQ